MTTRFSRAGPPYQFIQCRSGPVIAIPMPGDPYPPQLTAAFNYHWEHPPGNLWLLTGLATLLRTGAALNYSAELICPPQNRTIHILAVGAPGVPWTLNMYAHRTNPYQISPVIQQSGVQRVADVWNLRLDAPPWTWTNDDFDHFRQTWLTIRN